MLLADKIRTKASRNLRTGLSDTSAADVREIFGTVAEAVEFFEGLSRGAQILRAAGPPDTTAEGAEGLDGDAYIDLLNGDMYFNEAGEWGFKLTLKGAASTVPGPRGLVGPASTIAGPAGASAYQLWLAAGNTGTLAQYHAANVGRPGSDGQDGTNGSRMRWESYPPNNEPGQVGDAWFYTISATKLSIYECVLQASSAPVLVDGQEASAQLSLGTAWRLRFTSPEPTSTTTVTGATGTPLPAQAGNAGKVLSTDGTAPVWITPAATGPGGTATPLEQTLDSQSATAAPSVAATATAISGLSGKMGVLTNLQTTIKTSLVAAINEILGRIGVRVAGTTTVTFTQPTIHTSISSGTFTVDVTGAVPGVVVLVYLAVGAAQPSLPSSFQLTFGTYSPTKENLYAFIVGGNGRIQFNITNLA